MSRKFIIVAVDLFAKVESRPQSHSVDRQPSPAIMANKTVLITGSNRGLGLAFAKHYTIAGWNVIATTRKGSNSEHVRPKTLSVLLCIRIDADNSYASVFRGLAESIIAI